MRIPPSLFDIPSRPLADAFNIRYSTKYYDAESDLYYYGYRYYAPSLHRWLTRDPIAEEGGLNLYLMCENAAMLSQDPIGLKAMALMVQSEAEAGKRRFRDETKTRLEKYLSFVKSSLQNIVKAKSRFNAISSKGCVSFDGRTFIGTYEDYVKMVSREKNSRFIVGLSGGYHRMMDMFDEFVRSCQMQHDSVALCAHGSLFGKEQVRVLVSFNGEVVGREDIRQRISTYKGKTRAQVLLVSCYQTYSKPGDEATTEEQIKTLDYSCKVGSKQISFVPLKFVRCINGNPVVR